MFAGTPPASGAVQLRSQGLQPPSMPATDCLPHPVEVCMWCIGRSMWRLKRLQLIVYNYFYDSPTHMHHNCRPDRPLLPAGYA